MLTAVYEKMREEHELGPADEDAIRKFSKKDDSHTKVCVLLYYGNGRR